MGLFPQRSPLHLLQQTVYQIQSLEHREYMDEPLQVTLHQDQTQVRFLRVLLGVCVLNLTHHAQAHQYRDLLIDRMRFRLMTVVGQEWLHGDHQQGLLMVAAAGIHPARSQ